MPALIPTARRSSKGSCIASGAKYGQTWLDEIGCHQIQFAIMHDVANCTSIPGRLQRGYRANSNAAPPVRRWRRLWSAGALARTRPPSTRLRLGHDHRGIHDAQRRARSRRLTYVELL
ncbi:MAG: hypothetical protein ACLSDM_09660 [Butyricicoccus sp.]